MNDITYDWFGCYKGGWKGHIVEDAFQHPAKYARRLIARIYDHMIAEGLVRAGDSVVDPFGGVALGAFDAMRVGLHYTGNELEEKFWKLGNANIDLWNARYSVMPRWGTARLLHGDSRNLAALVGQQRAAMKSPPYTGEALGHAGGGGPNATSKRRKDYAVAMERVDAKSYYGKTDGNLGNLKEGDFQAVISSPVYEGARIGESSGAANVGHDQNYGSTPGQLGSMEGGDFSVAVSSPPYATIASGNGGLNTKPAKNGKQQSGRKASSASQIADHHYGQTEGQLSGMREGDYAAAVSSPPYEKGAQGGLRNFKDAEKFAQVMTERDGRNGRNGTSLKSRMAQMERDAQKTYGDSVGQLGQESGETFWLASRTIVEQVYSLLAPGGAPMPDGDDIDFCDCG